MSRSFTAGEQKTRPGVYKRYSNADTGAGASSALNGVVAIVLQSTWGPVGKVTAHADVATIKEMYGDCAGTEVALKALEAVKSVGTTPKIYIVRLEGTGGKEASATLGSEVKVNAKYPGAVSLTVKVQAKLSDATKKEIIILDGTTQKEKFEYTASESNESDAFVAAVAESAYITASKLADGVITAQETALEGGVTPTITNDDYLKGFEALEPYRYNVVITDSVDASVCNLLKNYVDSAFDNGKNAIAVIGNASTVDFVSRKTAAKAYNDEKVVYFGSGYELEDGTKVDGAPAVGYIAGVIAATPSNQSITHTVISGAVDITEKLTNAEYEEAIANGLLLLSVGPNNQIWIDSGINTLVSPKANQDAGWKKIKRVKVRFELFDRLDQVLEPKVGKVNADADGISYIIQSGNEVVAQMISEGGKISSATFGLDSEAGYEGDSGWFVIEAVDIDSLEKIYLHYRFKYSENS